MKRSIAALVSLLLPVLASGQSAAPSPARIGAAGAVKGVVKAESNAVGRVIESGKPLFLNDHVTTDKAGRLQVLLLDETAFTLGPNSDMVLDEFVYNPENGSGKVAARVTKGVFRFVTGKVARRDPANMTVKLPVGTIGIRGTMAIGQAESGNSTVILLGPGSHGNSDENKGAITFQNEGVKRDIESPGDGVTCAAGQAPSKVSDLSARAIELNEILSPSAAAAIGDDDSSGGAALHDSGDAVARGLTNGRGFEVDSTLSQALVNAANSQNGPARWNDVRSIETGSGQYIGAGKYTCTANCSGQGNMDFVLLINFGNRTIGGGSSQIQLSAGPISASNASLNSVSFAGLEGGASYTLNNAQNNYSGLDNFNGTNITLINSDGVVASEAQVDLKWAPSIGPQRVEGSMTGALH